MQLFVFFLLFYFPPSFSPRPLHSGSLSDVPLSWPSHPRVTESKGTCGFRTLAVSPPICSSAEEPGEGGGLRLELVGRR
ncbi:hypothetical protein QBC35DRAFT_492291 [Podospora australis]|uniref:Secreted protein n=1 Tax=Podospora australis TaxID=1536484 RepID=A0AAN6WWY8_9PEZI|nr:hypothetical protein QBC35DRAFT_492291 [Podospora australis]